MTGAASLNGTLNLGLLGGFDPTPPQTFVILTTSARTGTFPTVTGGGAGQFTVTYNPTNVTLVAN